MRQLARWRLIRRLLRSWWAFLAGFVRGLFDARLEHYAASLAWSTLFALVPLIVVMTAVVSGLPVFAQFRAGLEQLAYESLVPDRAEMVRVWIDRFVANARALGWLGTVYVALAVVLFFRTYDWIVNDICEAPARSWLEILRDYTLIMLTVPVFAAMAYWLSDRLESALTGRHVPVFLQPLRVLPWFVVWGLFWLLYRFSPNRPVDRLAALSSAFIAAMVWNISRWLFLLYVAQARTTASIYGSVAAMLFFLLWIHFSWLIFVYGLKFCHMLQEGEGKGRRA